LTAAHIVQGSVVNTNTVKWTVDVIAQYDRKKYFNIQVGSPYLHHSNGEGIYVMPEVGATVMVCIPSDSSAPFVLAFLMAFEKVSDSSADAPLGTTTHGTPPKTPTDATFAGGRPPINPGDIWFRTRDGNFVILHRGGVLSLGATELAQRIYIPLRNQVIDISENYSHYNAGGAETWGLQDGPSLTKYPAQHLETFRVFANDKYADVRIAQGRIFNPMAEPDGGALQSQAGITGGDDNPIIFEVAVSPQGFIAESGDAASSATPKNSVFRFIFDRSGNTFLRCEGNFVGKVTGALTLKLGSDFSIEAAGAGQLTAQNGLDIDGNTFVNIKGQIIRLGAGQLPVARKGDLIAMDLISAPIIIQFSSTPVSGVPLPCTLTTVASLVGSIETGNEEVLG
jgi:hypothetical protein